MFMKKTILFIISSFLILGCEDNNINIDQRYIELCGDVQLQKSDFSVLSFNRLNNTSLNSVSAVIDQVNPDIIGLQESYEIGKQIADRYNYCFFGSDGMSTAYLSRFPIEVINDTHIKIELSADKAINFMNVHLKAFPYQPYDIRDTLITTDSQAIHQAEQTRGANVDVLVDNINLVIKNEPLIICGDFNEPSHLDWVENAENPVRFLINNNQFTVDWPTSNKIANVGMKDSYRELFSSPVQFPGYTWTPQISNDEVYDRIDMIYHNSLLNVNDFKIIGPDDQSDIKLIDFESDHRAVYAIFSFD